MSEFGQQMSKLPPEQEAIRAKCFHPSGTFVEFPREEIEQSIPERFEKIVESYPDRIAIRPTNHAISYYRLNQLANRIARAILAHCGEGPEPVGILAPEGTPVIAAIFGVLKAGKFFVPMDPSFPHARIISSLEDSQAGAIVIDNETLPLSTQLNLKKRTVINTDELDASFSGDNIGLPISPDALAYILYTSGSTGEPKGIVQNQRNTLHVTMTYSNIIHICPDDRVTLLFSASTSAGVYGIFRTLLSGASLYPLGVKADGTSRMTSWLAHHRITLYSSVPTLFRHFCEALTEQEMFPQLRMIELLGETVYKRDVDSYKRCFSYGCLLANWLGSTEAGVVRCYIMSKETQVDSNILPAGFPLPDRDVLLLDDARKEVGLGDIGEIAVRSRYLSPGYWRRLDSTQAVFLPSRDGGDERIYLTGDMGRMLPDGCLVQLGRKDFQIKVRGQRVEITEIELALLEHPAIKEAVVIAKDGPTNEKQLTGYLVLNGKCVLRTSELRAFIREKLPEYMMPSAFVLVDALPLLPNGKVDRRALPLPSRLRLQLDIPLVVPRSALEADLARIWAEVLSLDEVGIRDDFFDLGGDSLSANRVMSSVLQHFQLEIPLEALFQSPTVAEMAAVINEHQGKKLSGKQLKQILTELESLSDDEAQNQLSESSSRVVKSE
jgi:amino acid adenylation domain-containing protein